MWQNKIKVGEIFFRAEIVGKRICVGACLLVENFSTLGGRIIQGGNLSLGTKLFERENILARHCKGN